MKQTKRRRRRNIGSEYLDPEKLRFHLRRMGWSIARLALDSDLTRNTVYAAFRGDGVHPHTAKVIADSFDVPLESLRVARTGVDNFEPVYTPPCHPEWEPVDGAWGRWHESSNALQYRICKLKHRFIGEDFARGKFYDLLGLKPAIRDDFTAHLTRHPQVCRMLRQAAGHPASPELSGIAENRNTSPIAGGDAWWVVDEWVEGQTLEASFASGVFEQIELRDLMLQLGRALTLVHRSGIILRELAPNRILVGNDGRIVLTELELAKLAGNYPTVSADWPEDPYRAPEVEGGHVTRQADLYSLGRIFLQAAAGELPESGSDVQYLAAMKLPKTVFATIRDCLSPLPDERPNDVTRVIRVFEKWKKRGPDNSR